MRRVRSRWMSSAGIGAALLITFMVSRGLSPKLAAAATAPDIAAALPTGFAGWRSIAQPVTQVDPGLAEDGAGAANPYDQVVTRNFVDATNRLVMLTVAYGQSQRQEVKIHRPELCYVAQGFRLLDLEAAPARMVEASGRQVHVTRLLARKPGRLEAVVYWIRIGANYSDSALSTRLYIYSEGMSGRIPDGVLVRASTIIQSPLESTAAFSTLESFLPGLTDATAPSVRPLLVR